MRVVQISDHHITSPGQLVADRVDPIPGLDAAIDLVNRIDDVSLVIGTGDLVNTGLAAEYDRLEASLARLRAPYLAVPGNHDDRTELRRRFALPAGDADLPIDHVVELGGVRLVCLDTTVPGRHDGSLSAAQLDWLDRVLASVAPTPTVIVQHHPIFDAGLPFMDGAYPLHEATQERTLIGRHRHVIAVWSGHVHRHAQCIVGSALASTAPSTAVSLAAAFGQERTEYSDEPCGLLVHDLAIDPSGCTTRLVAIGETERWTPHWAGD